MKLLDAVFIASEAHKGQVDKAGQPYIRHVMRVVEGVAALGEDAMVVAALHDVVEDTDWSLGRLEMRGLSHEQAVAIDALTRRVDERYCRYIHRVCENDLAKRVKLADNADNVTRLEDLPEEDRRRLEKRYTAALRILLREGE